MLDVIIQRIVLFQQRYDVARHSDNEREQGAAISHLIELRFILAELLGEQRAKDYWNGLDVPKTYGDGYIENIVSWDTLGKYQHARPYSGV